MTDSPRSNQGGETGVADARPARSGSGPSRFVTWLLLVVGGFMACWGTLVTVALLVVFVIQGPGPGGGVQFVLGGFVIGLAPMGFGSILFQLGRQRLREARAEEEAEISADP